ncbi:hypothetical protein [Nocardia tengchongensis]|uniref:hypothetical protein n=1 Tax=Nocardia tengchongensis TaxID=2055889 RepID=UPI00361467DD
MSARYAFRTGDDPTGFFGLDIDAPDRDTVMLVATAELIAAEQRIRAENPEG